MKRSLFTLAILIGISHLLSAQQKDSIKILPEIKVTAISKVNKQVERAFVKTFPDARHVRWFKINKDYFTRFIREDIDHSAAFQQNGYLKYDISYGYESDIPAQIREEAKSIYQDFMITRAANVKEGQRDIWVINLESLKHYVIARSENGELEEVGRYIKSE